VSRAYAAWMRWILGTVAVRSAAVRLRLCCKTNAEVIVSRKGFAMPDRMKAPASQRQPSCSQPQPISITCDLSASLQYSPQYLLFCSAGQSQGPCLHLFETSSAMIRLLVIERFSFGGIGYGYARRDRLDGQEAIISAVATTNERCLMRAVDCRHRDSSSRTFFVPGRQVAPRAWLLRREKPRGLWQS